METEHSLAVHWRGQFDEPALQAWATKARAQFPAPEVTLGLVFMTPDFFPHAAQVLELLRVHARIPLLAGCSSTSLIAGSQEIEDQPGIVLGLYYLPGAELTPFRFTQEQVEESNGPAYWHLETGLTPDKVNGWLVFLDPFQIDCNLWVNEFSGAYQPRPMVGGMASSEPSRQSTQLYLNGDVFEEGGVALAVGGLVDLSSVVSQGCTPIGSTWTITKADQNMIHEIGNRPAYEVLIETFENLPEEEQKKSHGNLFIGLVVNEYQEDFHRGDFLIRNIIGANPQSGSLAVGALPRAGQTIQFQRRDAMAADEELLVLLEQKKKELGERNIYGGCLCACNGRGHRLFGYPGHDAGMVQEHVGPIGLTGFFCNGEIGPVGESNFLHGYTASLALFTRKERNGREE
jgi:small ligand-binding sensory domain FIST